MRPRFSLKQLFLILMMVLRFSEAFAQASLSPSSFKEVFAEDVIPVSGTVVVGVQQVPEPAQISSSDLRVLMPPGSWRELQVTITAVNGTYDAVLTYAVPSVTPGLIALQIPTKRPNVFTAARPGTLAVYARATAADKTTVAVLAGWRLETRSSQIAVAVNSRGWDTMIFSTHATRGTTSGNCNALQAAKTVAFDKVCTISLPNSGDVSVLIRRQRFEVLAPDIRLIVRLP